jgi:SlyX protein
MNDDRLTELEIKYAHQEQAVEQLEKTTFEQHRRLEELAQQLQRLTDKLEGLTGPGEVGPGDQKPPHY